MATLVCTLNEVDLRPRRCRSVGYTQFSLQPFQAPVNKRFSPPAAKDVKCIDGSRNFIVVAALIVILALIQVEEDTSHTENPPLQAHRVCYVPLIDLSACFT